MRKGYHVLDGHNLINSFPETINQLHYVKYMDLYFNKYYSLCEKMGIELQNDISIVLGDWRKFDPDYDPNELFRAIEEEGRQGREFKERWCSTGELRN